ncbi:MAG: transketolase [Bacteroidales bacterium]
MFIDSKVVKAEKWAKKMRIKALQLALSTGKNGSHVGGGMSAMEIFAVLYSGIVNNNKEICKEVIRDRVIISKGHGVLAYYTALWLAGFITDEELDTFDKNGTHFYGHPCRCLDKGIEFSAGSLSLGVSYGVGVALSCRLNNLNNRIFVVLGDGECNEGLVWESLMAAVNFNLCNLTLIVDSNGFQLDGDTRDVMNMFSLEEKFKAFGFHTIIVDGHSCKELADALSMSFSSPQVIIAKTVKGKGIVSLEKNKLAHHCVLSQEQYDDAIKSLM